MIIVLYFADRHVIQSCNACYYIVCFRLYFGPDVCVCVCVCVCVHICMYVFSYIYIWFISVQMVIRTPYLLQNKILKKNKSRKKRSE